jgi:cell division protein ZapA (FtsZ GTPase activity inhibitor)
MDKSTKFERVRELTALVAALDGELKQAKAKVKNIQAEIRKTEAMREELITSTETQTTFA